MQDVRENPARTPKRTGKRIGDWPEDEPTRRQLGEIGQQRCNEVAEIQLAGFHEVSDRVLCRLECADQRLADVPANLACFAGIVAERCGDRLPAGDGRFAIGFGGSGSSPGRSTSAGGRLSGIVKGCLEPPRRVGRLGQRVCATLITSLHRVAQGLPAGEWRTRAFGQILRGTAIRVGRGKGNIGSRGKPEIGGRERVVLKGTVKGSLCGAGRGSCCALKPVLDLAQFKIGDDRDAPFGPERFQPLVDAADEAVDARDHAVQHRLDAVDQAVRRLERQIADGRGQQTPDRLDRLIGAIKRVRGGVAKSHDALDGALHSGGGIGLQIEEHRRGGRARRRRPHSDPLPDLDGEILQKRHGLAEAARTRDETGELIDQLARTHDQRPDAGPDQCAAQHDERRGEPAHGERCGGHSGDPTPRKKGHKGRGIGGQTADIVEETANGDAERAGAAGNRRHGIGDGFQRRSSGDGQLVREPAPDQAKPGDRVIGALDLVGVLFGDDDTEGEDVLRRLAQRRGVDPRHGDGAFLTEELACHGGAFGRGHEVLDGGVDRTDALVQRQRDQLGGGKAQPVERIGGGAGPGGRLAEATRQILGRLLDAGHRHACQLARTLQGLDRGDGGAEGLGELGLCIDGLQTGPNHGHASSRGGSDRSCSRNAHSARETGEPGIRRLHLATETAEAARAGLADTFQFGAHLSAANRGEADGHTLFSHRDVPSVR